MNEEAQQPEVAIQGPGQILKQARENAKLTTQDIADKIRLKKTLIEDIEQDNYDINLSLTFVKGYLKLYAKHVDVSESEVLTAFDNLNTQEKEPAKLQSFSRRIANQANDDKLMLVTYLIVALVIALVVVWWLQQSSTDTSQVSEMDTYANDSAPQELLDTTDTTSSLSSDILEAEQVNPLVLSDAEIKPKTLNQIQPNPTPVVSQQNLANTNTAQQVQTAPSSSEVSNTLEPENTSIQETTAPVELVFEFAGDCWMKLTDATGEDIAFGVKTKGRVMPVSGIPPFEVTLGAPEVVKISYSGEPLDMSFLTPGRIAKFTLPLSE